MANMSKTKVPMPEQDPLVRNKNFKEVAIGYDESMAMEEAERCLNCKNRPCVAGCPVNVQIPDFISLIKLGDFEAAYNKVVETNSLPAICGRVCPQENQCEELCIRGKKGEPVGIGRLERFVADRHMALTGNNKTSIYVGKSDYIVSSNNECRNETDSDSDSNSNSNSNSISNSNCISDGGGVVGGEGFGVVGGEGVVDRNGTNDSNSNSIVKSKVAVKVAVIGSGPAGLTCAGDLAKMGYKVTIFEAFHKAGGVLVYGIPEFRLPKELVRREIERMTEHGVKIITNMVGGKTFSIDELFDKGFEAVFIGTGAGLPSFLKIPGENLNGVYSANEFLTRTNLMKAYDFPNSFTPIFTGKRVAVIGGGNVAMDAARCAKRMGSEEVYIIYRRTADEMPARAEEVHHAEEEGIIFKFLSNPIEIKGDENGWVNVLKCIQMELGVPDESGRRKPYPKQGSEFDVPIDTVIVAIGQSPNPLLTSATPALATEKWGGIIADSATGATNIPGVFAGGDAVTGAATVILAMGAGKASAKAIDKYIQSKN